MTKPVVSILISNYNYGRFLRQAIDSALNQTYPHTEVVVVDDGSTDGSVEIIASYGNRIRSVLKENGGQASALNAAYAASTGEIIALLDADDYLDPDGIEQIVAHWKEGTGILHHRPKMTNNAGDHLGFNPDPKTPFDAGDVVPLLLRRGHYGCPPTSGLAYSRNVLGKVMPIPEADWRLCADAYIFVSAPFFSPVEVMPVSVAYYRLHDSNNYGDPHAEWLSPKKIETFAKYMAQRHILIKSLAAKLHLQVSELPTELAIKLFLYRAASADYRLSAGAALYGKVLRHLWLDPGLSWKYRLKKSVTGLIIVLAPRPLLNRLYPGSFAQKRQTGG